MIHAESRSRILDSRRRCGCALPSGATAAHAADVVRYSLPNNFPIARAVEVPAGKTIIFHSGTTPTPADPKADARLTRVLGRHEDADAERARTHQGIAGLDEAGHR